MADRFFIDNLWRWKCGLEENKPHSARKIDLTSLRKSEWVPEFESLMRNRLILGAIRYGKFKEPGKSKYDHIPSMIKRLKLYQDDGNMEHLVDVANLCMCEFVEPSHNNAHFSAIDEHDNHVDTI